MSTVHCTEIPAQKTPFNAPANDAVKTANITNIHRNKLTITKRYAHDVQYN